METILIAAASSLVFFFIGHLWGYVDGFKEGDMQGFYKGYTCSEKEGVNDIKSVLKD